jgi:nitroreductase
MKLEGRSSGYGVAPQSDFGATEADTSSARKGMSLRAIAKAAGAKYLGSVFRPTRLRTVLRIIRNSPHAVEDYLYDSLRYLWHSSTVYCGTRDNRLSRITAMYHSVERGLALPEPSPSFGARNIAYLIEAIEEYVRRFGADSSLNPAVGALDAYLKFHERINVDPPNRAAIEHTLRMLEPIRSIEGDGGTLEVSRESIHKATSNVTADFFLKRHSIRQYSDKEVSEEDIDAAIAMAQKTPAVCNRQECRVYVVHDKNLMTKMLAIQESRGFNHQINKLLVVTNRLTAFYGVNERNQCWIDGGMFAMSLVLALHSRGLGTCCLNWSKSAPPDRAMRKLLKLPPAEVIIMLMAVGHLPATLSVARSVRLPLESARRHIFDESEIRPRLTLRTIAARRRRR